MTGSGSSDDVGSDAERTDFEFGDIETEPDESDGDIETEPDGSDGESHPNGPTSETARTEHDGGVDERGDRTEALETDPFSELESSGDELADAESVHDPFERMEVDEPFGDDVWDALDEEFEVGGKATTVDAEGTEHVVEKREYCQRCPHFSLPPETACTHEDGTIVEVIDTAEFRVRGCPMVSESGPRFDRHG